jgi:hypothetical protein
MFAYKHTRKPADYTVETRGLAEQGMRKADRIVEANFDSD